MQPAISVIVPAYNAAATLPRCLDSLLGQTLREMEILVIDDGSPDASAARTVSYFSSGTILSIHSRFRVII